MFNQPESYPWDAVFDGDKAQTCWLRKLPWLVFEEWETLRYAEDHSWGGQDD